MSMRETVRAELSAYGRTVWLQTDNQRISYTACIIPAHYNNVSVSKQDFSRFGKPDNRLFSYYGPPDGGGEQLAEGDLLFTDTGCYEVLQVYDFEVGGEPVYRRAMLRIQPEVSEYEPL